MNSTMISLISSKNNFCKFNMKVVYLFLEKSKKQFVKKANNFSFNLLSILLIITFFVSKPKICGILFIERTPHYFCYYSNYNRSSFFFYNFPTNCYTIIFKLHLFFVCIYSNISLYMG